MANQILLDKLKRTEGPDRELDAEIARTVQPKILWQSGSWVEVHAAHAQGSGGEAYPAPAYTASIDTAMTLGRDDWERADMMLTAMGALGNPDHMKTGTWLKLLPIALCTAAFSHGGELAPEGPSTTLPFQEGA